MKNSTLTVSKMSALEYRESPKEKEELRKKSARLLEFRYRVPRGERANCTIILGEL